MPKGQGNDPGHVRITQGARGKEFGNLPDPLAGGRHVAIPILDPLGGGFAPDRAGRLVGKAMHREFRRGQGPKILIPVGSLNKPNASQFEGRKQGPGGAIKREGGGSGGIHASPGMAAGRGPGKGDFGFLGG